MVGYHVGCRLGESLPLKWFQVDLAAAQIRLQQGTTKNDEARTLPIYGDMLAVLTMHRQERDQEWPRYAFVFHRCGPTYPVSFRWLWVNQRQ